MSNTTPNLDLFKWDTTNRTDLASKFNIPVSMNENWDKLDTAVANKVDKVTGKGLSTNDYTTNEKNKLAGIEAQANKTVVDVSLSETSTNPVQNKKVYEALAEKQEQIDALVEENSTLKKQQLKGQASGSSIQLTDSAEDLEIENVVIKGATEQAQYEGKNLYNVNTSKSSSESTIIYDDYSVLTTNNTGSSTRYTPDYKNVSTDLQTNTDYWAVIEIKAVSGEGKISFFSNWADSAKGQFITNVQYSFANLTAGQKIKAKVTTRDSFDGCTSFARKIAEFSAGQSGSITYRISVLANEPDLSTFEYEPYCGAQASPNKDYPQEVHCVTGDCNVRVTNKNLFNKNNANVVNGLLSDSGKFQSNSYENAIIFNANPNVTYTISRNVNNHSFFRVAETSQYPNFGIEYKNRIKQDNTSKITYTTSDSAKYLIINFYSNTDENITLTEMLDSIQIEKNTTNTEYVTNQEQNAPLSLGNIELCDNDKIQISFINKAGYKKVTGASIIKKWKSGVIDGSETIQLMDTLTNTIRYAVNNILNPKALQFGKVYSNYLICYDSQRSNYNFNNSANDMEAIHIRDDQFGLGLKIKKTTASTVEGLKTWLQSHNLNYTYELKTPETTAITDTTLLNQLETLINMKTYKQITNIETTGSDLAPVLEFQYSKDLQTVIDSINARLELVEN